STRPSAFSRSRRSVRRNSASTPWAFTSVRSSSACARAALEPASARATKRTIWQRESKVAGTARARGRIRMITVAAGGSSRVLRNACGVSSVIRSASSRMNTLRRAIAGRSAACRSSSRIAPIRSARVPRGFDSGGVGTITCRSGCDRAELPSSSSANASAVVIRPAPAGPMKAYAWATRSLARARRSSSTARGWSRMRSSATEELLDDRAHRGLDHIGRLRGADQANALGLGAQDLAIAPAHLAMARERLSLEAVEAPALRAIASEPGRRIEAEEEGEVGHDAAGRARVQLADQVGIDAASVPLIRDRRVGIPIAEHDAAPVEPRPDLLRDVLLASGHEEEDFDERLGLDAEIGRAHV